MALGMLTRLARNALFFAASVLALMLWIKGKAPLSEIMKAFGG